MGPIDVSGLATRSELEGASRVHCSILPDRLVGRPIGRNISINSKIKSYLSHLVAWC
jgi:hypothetical protein